MLHDGSCTRYQQSIRKIRRCQVYEHCKLDITPSSTLVRFAFWSVVQMLLFASVNRQFTANHVSAYLPGSPLSVRVRCTDLIDYFGPDICI